MGIQLLENGVKLAGLGPEPPFRPVTRSFDHALKKSPFSIKGNKNRTLATYMQTVLTTIQTQYFFRDFLSSSYRLLITVFFVEKDWLGNVPKTS